MSSAFSQKSMIIWTYEYRQISKVRKWKTDINYCSLTPVCVYFWIEKYSDAYTEKNICAVFNYILYYPIIK